MLQKLCIGIIFFYICVGSAQSFKAQKLVVAGPSSYLVQTVKKISQQGGNIFDSAIAGAFSLSVTHPYFVSLGCGGFALLKDRSGVVGLDFRETAPLAMSQDFYINATKKAGSVMWSRRQGTAVGVPGFVAGLWAIHQKYGLLPWSRLLQPAITLAEKGFIISGDNFDRTKKHYSQFNRAGKRVFFHTNGQPYLPGERLKQKKLAKALRLLVRRPQSVFYKGVIGQDIVDTVRAQYGVMSNKDLNKYRSRWLSPISFNFNNYVVHSMPLPSSGGIILIRALQLIKQQKKRYQPKLYSVDEWHLLGEVLSLAFRPRHQMGDLGYSKMYLKHWLPNKQLTKLGRKISISRVKKWPVLKDTLFKQINHPPKETTHFSIMNNKNEAVSMTLTLNSIYGSFVVTNRYGIVLNNQMDDFNTEPGKANQFGLIQGVNNRVRAGRRPLSSMTPTIVVKTNSSTDEKKKNEQVALVLGGAGGPMIISSVFQVLYRYLINGWDLDQAVQAPRIHHQFLPPILYVEKNRFSPLVLKSLRKRGHKIKVRNSIAKVYATARGEEGLLEGAYDARGEGAVGGF